MGEGQTLSYTTKKGLIGMSWKNVECLNTGVLEPKEENVYIAHHWFRAERLEDVKDWLTEIGGYSLNGKKDGRKNVSAFEFEAMPDGTIHAWQVYEYPPGKRPVYPEEPMKRHWP